MNFTKDINHWGYPFKPLLIYIMKMKYKVLHDYIRFECVTYNLQAYVETISVQKVNLETYARSFIHLVKITLKKFTTTFFFNWISQIN